MVERMKVVHVFIAINTMVMVLVMVQGSMGREEIKSGEKVDDDSNQGKEEKEGAKV